MTKLLEIDLRRSVPGPEARPHQADLNRLFDDPADGLCRGQSQESLWGRVRVTLVDDRESPPGLTDFMMTVPFYVVSRRFVELLVSHNCDCEYLPLEATYKRKVLLGEFFALNVLNIEKSAADLDHSIFDRRLLEFGLMRDVEKLVLKDDPIGRAPIAYFEEVGRIAVNEALAEDLALLTGVRLVEPKVFTS